ncbi:TrkH family potassium uptake protein [Hippea jasoniae]|uniref:TrkH family potassium uptake protein n=1 Tax=Hippea jasoniae TaxID=944479 RepID=UPI0005519781|nr:TrkH family potassium uptake protein [Hippea jasoniae]
MVSKNPLRTIVIGFFTVIMVGCLLLMMPFSSYGGVNFVDALFTATSAVCVTGLIVVSMSHFTLIGQLIILLLIQVGGFGYMSITSFVILAFKKKLSYRDQIILKEAFNYTEIDSLTAFFRRVMMFALFSEILGAVVLFFVFYPQFDFLKAFYFAVFHSISAFNNAGFSLFSDSFVGYKYNVVLNFTVMALIIAGGIGFIVVDELILFKKKVLKYISLHTKLTLLTTAILIFGGAFLIYLLERNNILSGGGFFKDMLVCLFQSVTTRTAGFNTVNLISMHNSTLFLMIVLMFIGASVGGTGGGIKTTTAASVVVAIVSYIRGSKEVHIFKRRIPDEIVYKSFVIIILSFFVVSLAAFVLSDIENANFLSCLFETVSALSTVGLSISKTNLSLSNSFNDAGKLIIIFLMFAGRIGLFSFSVALFRSSTQKRYSLPEGRIFV